ncbi:hypothetical protein PISMIDRAFT_23207 [Pisolithus microcarpus 441]|uniref:Uncharacterized protein n=1 Tax=Pisolithus microcarpus 441 TaxID=765257 RepID=A0A0C9YGX7_9AGAM|nr:hypothetical protein BKA83DRAFT_23207 [Pisolithus microcarpus]KIK24210.1 hypothetical protein PISMIDRAFT_23207 [Pisolithus microcarpus 441]
MSNYYWPMYLPMTLHLDYITQIRYSINSNDNPDALKIDMISLHQCNLMPEHCTFIPAYYNNYAHNLLWKHYPYIGLVKAFHHHHNQKRYKKFWLILPLVVGALTEDVITDIKNEVSGQQDASMIHELNVVGANYPVCDGIDAGMEEHSPTHSDDDLPNEDEDITDGTQPPLLDAKDQCYPYVSKARARDSRAPHAVQGTYLQDKSATEDPLAIIRTQKHVKDWTAGFMFHFPCPTPAVTFLHIKVFLWAFQMAVIPPIRSVIMSLVPLTSEQLEVTVDIDSLVWVTHDLWFHAPLAIYLSPILEEKALMQKNNYVYVNTLIPYTEGDQEMAWSSKGSPFSMDVLNKINYTMKEIIQGDPSHYANYESFIIIIINCKEIKLWAKALMFQEDSSPINALLNGIPVLDWPYMDAYALNSDFMQECMEAINMHSGEAKQRSYGIRDEYRMGGMAMEKIMDDMAHRVPPKLLGQVEIFLASNAILWIPSKVWFELQARQVRALQMVQISLKELDPPNLGILTGIICHMIQCTPSTPITLDYHVCESVALLQFSRVCERFGLFFLSDLDMWKAPHLKEVWKCDDLEVLKLIQAKLMKPDGHSAWPRIALDDDKERFPSRNMPTWSRQLSHLELVVGKLFVQFTCQLWIQMEDAWLMDPEKRPEPMSLEDAVKCWTLNTTFKTIWACTFKPCNAEVPGSMEPGYISEYHKLMKDRTVLEQLEVTNHLAKIFSLLQTFPDTTKGSAKTPGKTWRVEDERVVLVTNPKFYNFEGISKEGEQGPCGPHGACRVWRTDE